MSHEEKGMFQDESKLVVSAKMKNAMFLQVLLVLLSAASIVDLIENVAAPEAKPSAISGSAILLFTFVSPFASIKDV